MSSIDENSHNICEKAFLKLPRQHCRRTSLPNEEKFSPNISPRRILEYIKVFIYLLTLFFFSYIL
jgi:hypothetical protein